MCGAANVSTVCAVPAHVCVCVCVRAECVCVLAVAVCEFVSAVCECVSACEPRCAGDGSSDASSAFCASPSLLRGVSVGGGETTNDDDTSRILRVDASVRVHEGILAASVSLVIEGRGGEGGAGGE